MHDFVLYTFKAICRGSGENGVNWMAVADALKTKGITKEDVEREVESLSAEGQIYTTIDEKHIRTTDDQGDVGQ